MAVLAECDICGNQHRVKDELVGTKIRCRDCGTEFPVPDGHVINSDDFIEVGGRLQRRVSPTAFQIWPWIFIGVITVFVAVTLVAAVWTFSLMFRPAQPPGKARCENARLQ